MSIGAGHAPIHDRGTNNILLQDTSITSSYRRVGLATRPLEAFHAWHVPSLSVTIGEVVCLPRTMHVRDDGHRTLVGVGGRTAETHDYTTVSIFLIKQGCATADSGNAFQPYPGWQLFK